MMSAYRQEQVGDCLLIQGDCRDVLPTLEAQSVHCVITSPPYWGLRDYGLGNDQIGLEAQPDCLGWVTGSECGECYVCHIVGVFRFVWRVLRDDGTLWLNLGDSYNSGSSGGLNGSGLQGGQANQFHSNRNGRKTISKLKPKNLIGIPWRVALALQADGWILRRPVIWAKPNPMPESVQDRPTSSHEYMFLFAKSQRHYYDGIAIREPASHGERFHGAYPVGTRNDSRRNGREDSDNTTSHRNKRDVWHIATTPFPGAHFAVFPRKLVEPCLLAGTSAKGVCAACGAPWERVVEKETYREIAGTRDMAKTPLNVVRAGWRNGGPKSETLGWQATCHCNAGSPVPATVLDPFAGSGTVACVAKEHNRAAIAIEMKPDYFDIMQKRVQSEPEHQFKLFV